MDGIDLAVFGCDRPVMVTPARARPAVEVSIAADLSAERNQVVDLPLDRDAPQPALAASVCM